MLQPSLTVLAGFADGAAAFADGASIRGGEPHQIDDHFDSLLHVLHRDPFVARVEVVLAGEQVGRRQPHERQTRAVRPAADGTFDRLGAGEVVGHARRRPLSTQLRPSSAPELDDCLGAKPEAAEHRHGLPLSADFVEKLVIARIRER